MIDARLLDKMCLASLFVEEFTNRLNELDDLRNKLRKQPVQRPWNGLLE